MSRSGRVVRWTIGAVMLGVLTLWAGQTSKVGTAPLPSKGALHHGPSLNPSLKQFSEAYGLIEANYADPVSPDVAIYGPSGDNSVGAIPGMLRRLDPHSNFFDPTEFAKLRQEMSGNYFGVGMRIAPRLGKSGKMVTVVDEPMPGSPAFRAGLRPGDVIAAVNAKSTADMDTTTVANLLRGPRGTQVRIAVVREGSPKPLEFTLTRDKITTPSVEVAFMIRPGVAYIHINAFNETTNPELSAALNRMGQQNIRALILDLRGNRGGLLQQAVAVSSHFLRKNQLIVYHYGLHSPEERYYAIDGEQGPEYPIVVLINKDTASAAEIVTGALQDHDRALVMGQRSFGKGLVQTEFPLSNDTMLLLTTARYYTPSGRLIQRDYSNISLYDYYYQYDLASLPHTQVRLTDGGREMYGGGGITPDVAVPLPKLNPTEQKLVDAGAFFDFGDSYLASHKTVPPDFRPGSKAMEAFRKFLVSENIPISNQDFKSSEAFIREHIRAQLIGTIYGENAANQIRVDNDPLVQRATDSFAQAKELMVHARRYMASRGMQ
ncbi:MAG: S41 family peptidase [Terriglobia bacterium]